MAQLTEAQYAEDWLRWMVQRNYCLMADVLTAAGGGTGMLSGQILEGAVGARIKIAGANPATAVLVEPVTAAEHVAGCTKLILVRGPAIINYDEMPTFSDASDLTDLEALGIWGINDTLVTWSKQTT